MALGKFSFVPTSTSGALVPWDEIPEETRNDLEEAFVALSGNSGRIHAVFENEGEKNTFSQYAASWAAQRPAGKLVFRWSPTRGNEKHEGDFTIKRDVTGNGNGGDATVPAENKSKK